MRETNFVIHEQVGLKFTITFLSWCVSTYRHSSPSSKQDVWHMNLVYNIIIALPLPSTGLLYLSSTTSTLITRRSQEIWFLLEELRFFPSHLSHWQNKVHLLLLREFTFFQTYHCLLCNHSVRHFCNALGQVGAGKETAITLNDWEFQSHHDC